MGGDDDSVMTSPSDEGIFTRHRQENTRSPLPCSAAVGPRSGSRPGAGTRTRRSPCVRAGQVTHRSWRRRAARAHSEAMELLASLVALDGTLIVATVAGLTFTGVAILRDLATTPRSDLEHSGIS